MLPLKLMRILDYAQPRTEQQPRSMLNGGSVSVFNDDAIEVNEVVERRKPQDRRSNDRREKQAATFLNTRKRQGRRVSHGRRASDLDGQLTYKPISLKG